MNFLLLLQSELTGKDAAELVGARAEHARAQHEVTLGSTVAIVLEGQGQARGRVTCSMPGRVSFSIEGTPELLPRSEIHCIVGLARPQTLKKVLELGASLGVCSISFVATERGEKSYQSSNVLREEELREHLIKGLEQSGEARFPEVTIYSHLKKYLGELWPSSGPRPGLGLLADSSSKEDLKSVIPGLSVANQPLFVAVGPEAGWSEVERAAFLDRGFYSISLGPRVLRVENALALLLGQIQLLGCTPT